jgi:hypothetical protein
LLKMLLAEPIRGYPRHPPPACFGRKPSFSSAARAGAT